MRFYEYTKDTPQKKDIFKETYDGFIEMGLSPDEAKTRTIEACTNLSTIVEKMIAFYEKL